jgi:uncharacterized protein YjdB
MIASALDEMVASATNNFPASLTAMMAKYGITLLFPGAVQKWIAYETEELRSALVPMPSSMMSVRWAADVTTQLARPSAGVRDSVMPVIVTYTLKTTDVDQLETHMKYVPEAMALWLDTFPIASRVPGSLTTITKIAPPLGKKITMRQKKEIVRVSGTVTNYEWNIEAEFDIEIRDTAPGAAPVASISISPTSGSVIEGHTLQATSTVRDGGGNVLVGRNSFFANTDDSLATIDAAGLITGRGHGSTSVFAACERHIAVCTLTVLPAVASVTVTPNPLNGIIIGVPQALTVVLKDALGNALTGRAIIYQSANNAIATADTSGNVLAIAPGSTTVTVTCENITVAVPVTVNQYLAFDSFTRADSVSSPGSATEIGGAWAALTGTWGISSGQLYCSSLTAGALCKLGSTLNGSVQADETVASFANGLGGLFFRESNTSNFLLLDVDGATVLNLYTCIAGAFTVVATATVAASAGVPYTLKAAFAGPLVTCSLNGAVVLTFTLTGAGAALSGTGCGVRNGNPNNTHRWDNYQVTP